LENKVEIVSCETLMTTEYPASQFWETLIGTGCCIVAGVTKIEQDPLSCRQRPLQHSIPQTDKNDCSES